MFTLGTLTPRWFKTVKSQDNRSKMCKKTIKINFAALKCIFIKFLYDNILYTYSNCILQDLTQFGVLYAKTTMVTLCTISQIIKLGTIK